MKKDIDYIIYSIITLLSEIVLIISSITWMVLNNDFLFRLTIIGILWLIYVEIIFRTNYKDLQNTGKVTK